MSFNRTTAGLATAAGSLLLAITAAVALTAPVAHADTTYTKPDLSQGPTLCKAPVNGLGQWMDTDCYDYNAPAPDACLYQFGANADGTFFYHGPCPTDPAHTDPGDCVSKFVTQTAGGPAVTWYGYYECPWDMPAGPTPDPTPDPTPTPPPPTPAPGHGAPTLRFVSGGVLHPRARNTIAVRATWHDGTPIIGAKVRICTATSMTKGCSSLRTSNSGRAAIHLRYPKEGVAVAATLSNLDVAVKKLFKLQPLVTLAPGAHTITGHVKPAVATPTLLQRYRPHRHGWVKVSWKRTGRRGTVRYNTLRPGRYRVLLPARQGRVKTISHALRIR